MIIIIYLNYLTPNRSIDGRVINLTQTQLGNQMNFNRNKLKVKSCIGFKKTIVIERKANIQKNGFIFVQQITEAQGDQYLQALEEYNQVNLNDKYRTYFLYSTDVDNQDEDWAQDIIENLRQRETRPFNYWTTAINNNLVSLILFYNAPYQFVLLEENLDSQEHPPLAIAPNRCKKQHPHLQEALRSHNFIIAKYNENGDLIETLNPIPIAQINVPQQKQQQNNQNENNQQHNDNNQA
ncbi:hypothetical protein ABPG72_020157 [Tetrahymena utriculariae]